MCNIFFATACGNTVFLSALGCKLQKNLLGITVSLLIMCCITCSITEVQRDVEYRVTFNAGNSTVFLNMYEFVFPAYCMNCIYADITTL